MSLNCPTPLSNRLPGGGGDGPQAGRSDAAASTAIDESHRGAQVSETTGIAVKRVLGSDAVHLGAAVSAFALWLGYVCYVIALAYYPHVLINSGLSLPCVFKAATGLPCPFCGTTRSLASYLHGDLRQGALYNLFSLPLFILFTYLLWAYFFKLAHARGSSLQTGAQKAWLTMIVLAWVTKFLLPTSYW